ncbi:MAG: hypothetical protein LBU61_00845 [Coriobacteriales bacterium]|jgi:hypothetical protein|nr:hypothetical protein [Coriobacteriales bacterium]
MLTKKQNVIEVIKGGNPDRYVNQYEFMHLMFGVDPFMFSTPEPAGPGMTWHTQWGVLYEWPEDHPGGMPIHRPGTIVLEDIKQWRDVVKAPNIIFPEEAYADYMALAAQCDREDTFMTLGMFPGLLEITHHLMSMEGAMQAIALEPDDVIELVEWYVDWEIEYAKTLIPRIQPDALFHHDDWGSQNSTLISPAMFKQIYLPAYKRLYGWYKDNGIEYIIHHCDSYAATYVPMMIEMGIDIWQGCMSTNDIPNLIKQYGGQISFMGGIDNGVVDRADWTLELIDRETRRAIAEGGKLYYIPCCVMGGPGSSYEGVYDAVTAKIDELSKEDF